MASSGVERSLPGRVQRIGLYRFWQAELRAKIALVRAIRQFKAMTRIDAKGAIGAMALPSTAASCGADSWKSRQRIDKRA